MKLVWIKWFPTDWISDAELSKTSLLGRGLWIEALNAMYNSDTYALSGTPEELARVLRCSVAEFDTALSDLARHNACVLERRNGIVTLVSRRLERKHKERLSGRLRKENQRNRQKCHSEVPSASDSASDSASGIGVRGSGRKGFPVTPEDAIAQCDLQMNTKDFILQCYDKATSRGGCDAKNIPICDFPAYVRIEWVYEQNRRGEKGERGNTGIGNERARKSSKPDYSKGF